MHGKKRLNIDHGGTPDKKRDSYKDNSKKHHCQ